MLRLIKRASLLAFMLTMASPVFAQGPGGRGGFGMMGGRGNASPYALLSNSAIQEELSLTDEQKEKATELLGSMREAMRGDGENTFDRESFSKLSNEERRELFTKMGKERAERATKVAAEYKPQFAAILDGTQLQRLQQIQWQSQGIRALQDPDMAKELGLTQEQQDKIAAVFSENRGQGFGGGRGRNQGERSEADREAARNEFRAQREKLDTDVKAVLTDEQKSEMTNLLGSDFDVTKLRGGRGGRPGGERGQGGGRRNRGNGNNRPERPSNDN